MGNSNERKFPRNENGVKIRRDGRGDGFANAHRKLLGEEHWMQDVDAMVGNVFFATDSGNKLFAEYVVGQRPSENLWIQSCGWLALFDRKYDTQAVNESTLSTAVYLSACRVFSAAQPIDMPCRFFFSIGPQFGPWKIKEVNIQNGDWVDGEIYVDNKTRWEPVWNALGLTETRRKLTEWLRSGGGSELRSRPDQMRFDFDPEDPFFRHGF